MQTNLQNEGKILDWDCMEVDISRQGPIKDQMKVRIPRLSGQGIQLISLQLQMHCMEKAQMHNGSDVAADPQIVWAGYCNSLLHIFFAKRCKCKNAKQPAGAKSLWSWQEIAFLRYTLSFAKMCKCKTV